MENLEHFLKVILVTFVWFSGAFIFRKMLHKFFQKTDFMDEKKEETIENIVASVLNIMGVIVIILFTLQKYMDVSKLVAGAGLLGVALAFGAQSVLKDFLAGMFRLSTKKVRKGDFVCINGKYTGTIEEIDMLFLHVREWSGKLLSINNGNVKELQNYNIDKMRTIEKVIISYREEPQKIRELLEKTCETFNEKHEDFLLTDNEGNAIERFHVFGMSPLNSEIRGYEYIIVGLVKDEEYFNASKLIRFDIAQTLHENHIHMAEEQVYYQTRATTSHVKKTSS